MTPVKGSFVSPKGCDLHVENHCPNMTLPSTEEPGYKMKKAQSVLLCREEMKKGIVASSSCPEEGQETEANASPSPKTGKPDGCRSFSDVFQMYVPPTQVLLVICLNPSCQPVASLSCLSLGVSTTGFWTYMVLVLSWCLW